MNPIDDRPSTGRPGTARKGRGILGLSVGFLAGVLLAALVVPDTDEVVTQRDGGRSAAQGTGSLELGASEEGVALDADASGEGVEAGQPGSGAGGDGASGGGGEVGGGGEGTDGSGARRPAGGASAAGVTADEIVVGIGLPDIGAIAALGPGYDQGNPRHHVEAVLDQLRQDGRLPVHGRDIRPVFQTYNILSPESQRAACEGFAHDATVFAVVAIHNFGPGNRCTAEEFDLITITGEGQGDALYADTPNMISLQTSAERIMRNFVEWAHRRGDLTGKRIGVYYGSDPDAARAVRQSLIGPLRQHGHTIAAEVQTSEPSTGGPTDSVAVQRFRTNRVDVAILVVSAVAKTNFFNQAEVQGYRPTYLENDLGFSTTSTATGTYPAGHFDGTRAMTVLRFGEGPAGMQEPAEARWCMDAIRSRTGRPIDRQRNEAEYISANQACDELLVLLTAIEHAGPTLTREGFFAGLHSIDGRTTGIHGDLSFEPGRHHGVDTWRELVWQASCRCWVAQGQFQPLFVP
jgi:hypothetical protein